jgi:hypothetical protein
MTSRSMSARRVPVPSEFSSPLGRPPARIACLVPIFMALFVFTLSAYGRAKQDQKEPELRTVHGSVVDKDENPVASSVVYLKNVKTQDVKTYIADDSGAYRFSGLDPNVDYEIHAEHNDLTSSLRTISSYDSRRDINLVLKLAHKKADH